MPKIIDHDQRRRDIVEVAKRLILEGGFEAATMRSIAHAAGFANGALKHYFPGKDSIIAATFQSVLEEMGSDLPEFVEGASASKQLRLHIESSLPLDDHRITSGRVLLALWDHAMANEELADLYREHLEAWHEYLVRILQRGRAQGEFVRDGADEVLADEVISLSIGAVVMSLMYPGGQKLTTYQGFAGRIVDWLRGEQPSAG